MTTEQENAPWEQLQTILERGDISALPDYIDDLGHREAARAISRLEADQQVDVIVALDPEQAAELVEEVPEAQAVDLVQRLPVEKAAEILNHVYSNDLADVLGQLAEEHADNILDAMDPEEAREARRLIGYESDVAGGLMITEFLAFSDHLAVRDVIEDLRVHAEEYAGYRVQYTYIVSREGKLVGVLPLRDLILTPGHVSVKEIMIGNPISVPDTMPLDELASLFEDYHFVGVPVVDNEARLIGVVEREGVQEAEAERAGSDYLKSQGIVGGDELRSMPLWRRSGRRLSWLSVNIVLNCIAATVIAVYRDTLEQAIALAIFLPIISDMSGCSGNQAVAVSMRELSLGLIKPFEVVHVWLKEISVGIINGIVLGALIAAAGWIYEGQLIFGLVVGAALAINTLVAVSVGGCVPLLLKKVNQDPALASGPILTTVTDMCGFFLALTLAAQFLQAT